jgi:hypothetical protein
MPCSDSSSSIALTVDHSERFISFEFAKITCGREITAKTGYNTYCCGKSLQEIIAFSFSDVISALNVHQEEDQYVLYLEWDALRSAIAQYLGADEKGIDKDRCQITSIEHHEKGIDIAQVILPPVELPKILPCGLGDQN